MPRSLTVLRFGWPAILIDALLAVACYLLAYRLRFDAGAFRHFLPLAAWALPFLAGAHAVVLAALGVYRPGPRLWPVRLVFGTLAAAAAGFGAAWLALGPEGLSRQAAIAYGLMLVLAALAWRAAIGLQFRLAVLQAPPGLAGELETFGEHHRSIAGGLVIASRYRHLLENLVAKDLKLKYRGSVLGFAWSLVNPLVMIGVYTFAFTYVLKVPTDRYAFFVLLGLLSWTFFAGAVAGSTESVAGGGALLKSVLFPRIILPIAGVLFNVVQYLLTLAVFLPLMLVLYRVPPSAPMLLFPVFLALQILFTAGAALVLSTATAFMRDVKHLVEVGLMVAFWLTPIIYEHSFVPEAFRFAVLLSPMSSFIRAYQDIFYYGVWPDLSVTLVAFAYGLGMFVCGLSVFLAFEDRFAEQV
jgi:ABC-type polysaccharide/polyol phosphate export permease